MTKTVNVNIGGFPFTIDENAYLMLRSYLNQIEVRLSPSERREVIEDIERRIADLFNENISSRYQVVTTVIVQRAISIIGSAEDFGDPTDQRGPSSYSDQGQAQQRPTPPRRLTRSRSNRVLAGVCGGLAEFSGLDVAWIRVATVLFIFLGGMSIWVYIILWIVIPEQTRVDNLFSNPQSNTQNRDERR